MRSSAPASAPALHLKKVSKLFVDACVIKDLGATRQVLEKGHALAQVEFPAWMGAPNESMHAVAQASLADHAAEGAVLSLMGDAEGAAALATNLDFKLKYVAPAVGAVISAEARVIRCSRGIAVVEVDVYSSATKPVIGGVKPLDDASPAPVQDLEPELTAVAEATYVIDDDSITFPNDALLCVGRDACLI